MVVKVNMYSENISKDTLGCISSVVTWGQRVFWVSTCILAQATQPGLIRPRLVSQQRVAFFTGSLADGMALFLTVAVMLSWVRTLQSEHPANPADLSGLIECFPASAPAPLQ